MREIKFKAWDKTRNMMFPVAQIHYADDGFSKTILVLTAPKSIYFSPLVNGESCELMQFTGLTDKNKKDIYEGDVVKAESSANFEIIYLDEMGGFGGKEIVDEKGELLYGKIRVPIPLRKYITNKMIVIGNIYENPELLNK